MSEITGFIFFFGGIFLLGLLIAVARVFVNKKVSSETVLAAFAEGNYREARRGLEELMTLEPRNAMYFWYAGRCSINLGEVNQGIAEIRKAIQINKYDISEPKPPLLEDFSEVGLRRYLRDLYANAGKDNEAFQENQILMQLEPENVEYPIKLANLLIRKREFSERTQNFVLKGLEIESENPLLLSLMALIALMQKNWNRATNYAQKVLVIRPDSKDANAILGLAAYENGQLETAQKYLQKSESSESFKKKVAITLAKIFLKKEDSFRAEEYAYSADTFPISVYEEPDLEWDVKYWYASLLEKNGKIDAAHEIWANIEKFKPGYKDVKEKLKGNLESEIDYAKDFIAARQDVFEILCEKVVNQMGFKVSKIESGYDGNCNMILKHAKNPTGSVACFVRRNVDLINDQKMNVFVTYIQSMHCSSGLFISTGDFTRSAKSVATQNHIDCIAGNALEKVLVKVMAT